MAVDVEGDRDRGVTKPLRYRLDPSADRELLALGAELEEFIREVWLVRQAKDRRERDSLDAKMEAAGFDRNKPAPLSHEDTTGYWDTWHKIRREAGLPVTNEEEQAQEDSWDNIHDDMYDLLADIFAHKPKTIAGLAVLARAITLSDSHLWEDWHHEGENEHALTFINAVCAFLNVTPVGVEEEAAS